MHEIGRDEEGRPERRKHFRAGLEAGAVIHAGTVALRARIVDLSLGGVRLRRVDDSVPCPAVGTVARIDLEIGTRGWISTHGFVHRCELDEVVLAFAAMAPELEDLIEDEVLAAVEATRRPRMIVVDRLPERRRRVAEKLRAAGCDSYEAATPLEAIDLMERPRSHIRGVAVSERLTQTGVDEFCEFVAETNPGIKVALIAEALAEGTIDQPTPRPQRLSDRISAVVPSEEDTMETSLRGFVDSVSSRPRR
jgi:hypothetical protein